MVCWHIHVILIFIFVDIGGAMVFNLLIREFSQKMKYNLSRAMKGSLFVPTERLPSQEDVREWSQHFSSLVASPCNPPILFNSFTFIFIFSFNIDGLLLFRAFLMSEFSHENLDFWLAVQDFKKSKLQDEIYIKAKKIYNNFIESTAPNQVTKYTSLVNNCKIYLLYNSYLQINLDHETRSTIQNRIESMDVDQGMFDRAQRHIQYLMEQDSYARFKDSDLLMRAVDLFNMTNLK